ncbi:MAG: SusD/RagB family nutrient-binding outer membrane lipoprotein, partial [Pedobacter sp.]
ANAGGFGGFGAVVTYDFGTSTYAGLWSSSYDNANDYQYIINETGTDKLESFKTSMAMIMKALVFERLVNQFNNVPYSDALKGIVSLQPKYDKAEDIYKASIADLDKAMATITAGQAASATEVKRIPEPIDPLFKGDMQRWKQFANTIKLRMLIKMAGVTALQSFTTPAFTSMDLTTGFITADAIVQPGYEKTNRPNPVYNAIGFTTTGANTTTSRIPSKFIYSFYSGGKLSDPGRGSVIYRSFPNTPTNQLGDETAGVPSALSAGSSWSTGTNANNVLGVSKGATQGTPIMLAAESNFLQAEAIVRGYITTGSAATKFNEGITQSFTYLYKDVTGAVPATKNVATDVAAYQAANATSPLVNFTLAVSFDQKIEAIITQKYIALNMINNDEAFNEYRRTEYPKIVKGSQDPVLTFASRQSISTRTDKLPSRVLYPQEEYNLNPANAPTGINKFTSLIFWDIN